MTINLKHTQKRAQAYWYIDGLYELGFGILLLLISLTLILQWTSIDNAKLSDVFRITRQLLLFLGVITTGGIVRILKMRLTYPRTGYLAYQRPQLKAFPKMLITGMLIGGLAGLAISAGFFLLPGNAARLLYFPAWLTMGIGIFTAVIFASWALRTGL